MEILYPTIVNSLDEKVWREFVEHHPAGNIFHTPEMFQVFARAKGHRPVFRATVDGQGQVLALLLPVVVSLRNGLLRRLTTRSLAYGSVLCVPNAPGQAALTGLLRAYTQEAQRDALFTELRHLSDQSALQPVFTGCGFAYEAHLDYLIDLTPSADEVFQRIGARTRKHIRREMKKGLVTVEEVTRPDQLKAWYGLTQQSYQAARVPVADVSLFEAAFEVLVPRNMAKFWLARVGEAWVAASAELLYKDVILGWYGGVDRAYSEYTPTELLMWHILKWGADNGYRVYDFGGAGKPQEKYGVRDFKAKFGGELVAYGRNKLCHSPRLMRTIEWSYEIYRRLIGRF